jgi:hypothetical protein
LRDIEVVSRQPLACPGVVSQRSRVASSKSLVAGRQSLGALKDGNLSEINAVLDEEIELARRLHAVVLRDSRIGFEASNHYYYTANDLKEKILNCEHVRHFI